MNIMTKVGHMDNVVTYEHICDTMDDVANIDPRYITLGSVAIILETDAGLTVLMANSNKEWINLVTGQKQSNPNVSPSEQDDSSSS